MIGRIISLSTYLINVSALYLRHRDEVICKQMSIVLTDATHFGQALVTVKEEFFAQVLQLLRFFCQHVPESLLLI